MYTAGMPVHNGEKFLETLQELIGECRLNDIPVIYVQHNGPKDHPLEKGTDGWKIHVEIAPQEGDSIVEKTTPDSFHKTNLKKYCKTRESIMLSFQECKRSTVWIRQREERLVKGIK